MAQYTVPQLEAYWQQAVATLGAPSSLNALAPVMAEVATLESGAAGQYAESTASVTEPNGAGGTQTSNGLWQISTGTTAQPSNWSDPLQNAEYAVQKYMTQGPGAWPNTYPQALANLGSTNAPAVAAATATNAASTALATATSWPAYAERAVVVVTVLVLGSFLIGAYKS